MLCWEVRQSRTLSGRGMGAVTILANRQHNFEYSFLYFNKMMRQIPRAKLLSVDKIEASLDRIPKTTCSERNAVPGYLRHQRPYSACQRTYQADIEAKNLSRSGIILSIVVHMLDEGITLSPSYSDVPNSLAENPRCERLLSEAIMQAGAVANKLVP